MSTVISATVWVMVLYGMPYVVPDEQPTRYATQADCQPLADAYNANSLRTKSVTKAHCVGVVVFSNQPTKKP